MRKLIVASLAMALVFAARPAEAWNAAGHETVAYIAYKRLTPAARARVDALLARHPHYAEWVRGLPAEARGLSAFLKAANWPDVIQGDPRYQDGDKATAQASLPFPETPSWDLARHSTWHYTNLPFSTDGTALKDGLTPNVLTQITAFSADLKSASVPDATKTYELPWLIHMVGDVHQPLHTVARFSKEFPNGDRGGNSVQIEDPAWNLHSFWDGAVGSADDRSSVVELAASITAEIGDADVRKPADWVQEGSEIARGFVYSVDEIRSSNRAVVTKDYRARANIIARHRIAQAGYRLAAVLNDALE